MTLEERKEFADELAKRILAKKPNWQIDIIYRNESVVVDSQDVCAMMIKDPERMGFFMFHPQPAMMQYIRRKADSGDVEGGYDRLVTPTVDYCEEHLASLPYEPVHS